MEKSKKAAGIALLSKIKRRVYANEKLILFRFLTTTGISSPATIRQATSENLSDVLHFDTPDKLETYRQFLQRGDVGYLAYLNDSCIHRSWVIVNPGNVFLHWSLPMPLNAGEVYIHFCETAPSARGKKIFPHVLSRIAQDYSACRHIFICVNANNIHSVKSIEKAGFIPYKSFRTIALLNLRIMKKESPVSQ